MPDDVGGKPFPDGEEPESHGHGGADDPFASVVFDEEFVRSAVIHEPSAAERLLAADRARAEADAARPRPAAGSAEDDPYDGPRQAPLGPGELPGLTDGLDPDDAYGPYGRYGSWRRPYRGRARWHRPVAWVLAMVMGIGVIALAFAAVYRSASSGERRDPSPPPATTGVDTAATGQPGPLPTVPDGTGAPAASAAPHRG
ncbi:hypothetical protein ACIHFE_01425 [Streptomyces sp. NPDC052396]|uniref:SCO2584 family spore wall biosynthesis protein n=1 Tax=Streptomyces sp. NPDC052396 TaxID=3365689 RepID=UPI0037D035B0